jgi:hypothetical protein
VSEATVYRLLKDHGLITSPAFILMKAADRFANPTTAPNQLWQTDFTYLKVIGWGWFYLSTVLDDFRCWIDRHVSGYFFDPAFDLPNEKPKKSGYFLPLGLAVNFFSPDILCSPMSQASSPGRCVSVAAGRHPVRGLRLTGQRTGQRSGGGRGSPGRPAGKNSERARPKAELVNAV